MRRSSNRLRLSRSARVEPARWIRPGTPEDSIRAAMLTVSPHRSNTIRHWPMTPPDSQSARDTDPDPEVEGVGALPGVDRGEDRLRETERRLCMVGATLRRPSGGHGEDQDRRRRVVCTAGA
jgi:hypothetical protein